MTKRSNKRPVPKAMASHELKTARLTTADQVHDKLKMLLMTGALAPGQKLTLRGLAEQFGISVMPVRDAVRRLTAEGGLQMFPNRTIRVNSPTPERFIEIVKIRCALEGLATETACRQLNRSTVQKIARYARRFEREGLKARADSTLVSHINRDLHFTLYRGSNMPHLLDMIESLWIQVAPALSLTMRHTTRGVTQWESFTHHAKLVDSLNAKDCTRAKQAIVADIKDAGAFILRSGALEAIQEDILASKSRMSRSQHRIQT